MDLNIEGNPGTHNTYQEHRIGNVEQFYANPMEVNNNHSHVMNIHLNFSIHINGERVFNLMKKLQSRFCFTFIKTKENHFDGEGTAERTLYQLSGTSSALVSALRCIGMEIGESSIDSVRYISSQQEVDINHLTLSKALELIEYESGL